MLEEIIKVHEVEIISPLRDAGVNFNRVICSNLLGNLLGDISKIGESLLDCVCTRLVESEVATIATRIEEYIPSPIPPKEFKIIPVLKEAGIFTDQVVENVTKDCFKYNHDSTDSTYVGEVPNIDDAA